MYFSKYEYEHRVRNAIEIIKQVMFSAGVDDNYRDEVLEELDEILERAITNLDDWEQFFPEDD